MGHVEAVLIHLLIQIIDGVHLRMIVKTKWPKITEPIFYF
jgi:hypothetical protein